MIDIHCHLLAGVDDGPGTWDEVMEMVAQGMKDGIEGAVATSHIPDRLGPEVDRLYQAKFEELKERIEETGLAFQIFLGAEIFFQFGLEEQVGNLQTATFHGNGMYFLLELPLGFFPPQFDQVVFRLRARGLRPILAHPERYASLSRNLDRARDWVEQGVLLQINGGSLTGQFGRHVQRTARELVASGLVHFVGSDAHNITSRPLRLGEAREAVQDLLGEQGADLLFRINPERAIRGQEVHSLAPLAVEDRPTGWWRRWFSRGS